jgi:hypothetical protein
VDVTFLLFIIKKLLIKTDILIIAWTHIHFTVIEAGLLKTKSVTLSMPALPQIGYKFDGVSQNQLMIFLGIRVFWQES